MPKLWVGFLKCVYQTQPRSFHVLLQVLLSQLTILLLCYPLFITFFASCLQLPPPQLDSALNRHANLRGPLAAYANQPTVKSSLPR